MKRKVLFIASLPFINEKNTGGISIIKRNYKLLCDVFGKDCVNVCTINRDPKFVRESNGGFWAEGNLTGISNVLNEISGHIYITFRGERQLKKILKTGSYDLVWLDSPRYGRLAEYIKKTYGIPVITFAHNVESEYIKIYCRPSVRKPHYAVKIKGIEYNEKKAMLFSDYFICISGRDLEQYRQKFHCDLNMILPVTLKDSFRKVHSSEEHGYLLFVGSYFKPNVDGICWLIENVASDLNLDLKIVGRGMELIEKEGNMSIPPNVQILGEVEDLSECYSQAWAVVMPIFSGSGMKVKTAEALMYGKAVIATDEALTGYDLDGMEGVYRCNSADEFIQAIREVGSKRTLFYEGLRTYFLDHCEYEKTCRDMQEKILNLLDKRVSKE